MHRFGGGGIHRESRARHYDQIIDLRRRQTIVRLIYADEFGERVVASLSEALARALMLPCAQRDLLLSPADGQHLYHSRKGYTAAREVIDSIPTASEKPSHVTPYQASTRRFRILGPSHLTGRRALIVGKVVRPATRDARAELRFVTAFFVNAKWVAIRVRSGSLRALPVDQN